MDEGPSSRGAPTVEELGIGSVPYSPLGKGNLTGKMDENTLCHGSDFRNILPRFTPSGQTLIVTAGCGRIARWGAQSKKSGPIEVVWIPPGEKHWHGAAPTQQ